MRRSADFAETIRRGSRCRSGDLIAYRIEGADSPALVGLVVGKAVGGSVMRHRVSRRLRAQLAARLDRLPDGSRTVLRALPGTATAESAALGRQLDAAFARLERHPGTTRRTADTRASS